MELGNMKPAFTPARGPGPKLDLPHLKKIIAVASGKGGVGKSTVAANLAVALGQQNLRVGLLDADIYGPSQSRMMGLQGQRARAEDGKLIPLSAHGIKIISMGMLADESAPMIWRGPMIQTAFTQMLKDVAWGELDVLVIDLPPGTGDVQLSLAQKVDADGAVIVSTPQDIALIDARKAAAMFEKMRTPILGMIENMSFYCCENCGHRADIFKSAVPRLVPDQLSGNAEDHSSGRSRGGAAAAADKLGIPFLGAVPLESAVCDSSETGVPIVLSAPNSQAAQVFTAAATRVYGQIQAPRAA
jgi:ATP-binding protein involved in chromosome partitioning